MNEASRFGRMDIAAEHAAKGTEQAFLKRRREWGNDVRVVDINVAGVEFDDQANAKVLVQVAWTHMAEGTLHTTTLKQSWEDRGDGAGSRDEWQRRNPRRLRAAAQHAARRIVGQSGVAQADRPQAREAAAGDLAHDLAVLEGEGRVRLRWRVAVEAETHQTMVHVTP